MTDKHSKDDIRGNLVLTVGQVKEEKSFLKVRIGNNPEDVLNMKKQIKEECGQSPDNGAWIYFGAKVKPFAEESKFKDKTGGYWVDFSKTGFLAGGSADFLNSLPKTPFPGELFLELSLTSDKTFKEGFYNSFNARVSLDGSHDFARNLGVFIASKDVLPIHQNFLLSIIKKFSDFDAVIEMDTYDELKELIGEDPFAGLSNKTVEKFVKVLKDLARDMGGPETLAEMCAKGLRVVVFVNTNLYFNIEFLGDGVADLLKTK